MNASTTAAYVRGPRADRFAVAMALAIAVIVAYGFSFTVRDNLLAPASPRPSVLYVHAAVFSAWLLLFAIQAALVLSRRVDLHVRLGRAGLVLGGLVSVLGVATAFAMARFHVAHGETDVAESLPVPLWDMVCFTTCFVLAAVLRRRPAWHRRLMLLATIALSAAAFGRIPLLDHAEWFYSGVDALIIVAAVRDRWAEGRVHPVYRAALPAFVVGQAIVASVRWSPGWLAFAATLFRP
jgi:hypothetical protein